MDVDALVARLPPWLPYKPAGATIAVIRVRLARTPWLPYKPAGATIAVTIVDEAAQPWLPYKPAGATITAVGVKH